jgi:hypothetical protein
LGGDGGCHRLVGLELDDQVNLLADQVFGIAESHFRVVAVVHSHPGRWGRMVADGRTWGEIRTQEGTGKSPRYFLRKASLFEDEGIAMTNLTRSHKMDRIVRALVEHGTRQKAAAALGMSEVTVWRWMQKPEYQETSRAVRREALSRSSGRLLQGSSAAAATMLKLMLDPTAPAAVRVRAAEGVLAHAEKTFELEDVDVRLQRLEQATRQQ